MRLSDGDLEGQLARVRDSTVDSETRQIIAALEARRGEAFTTGDEAPSRF